MHWCVKVSVDDLLAGQPADIVLVCEKLLAEIYDWEGVTISCSKNYIVFVHKQTFFLIRPMKNQLALKFYSENKIEDTIVSKSTLIAKRYENHINIISLDDLTPKVLTLIRGSYTLL
jgi:hypothetical protein